MTFLKIDDSILYDASLSAAQKIILAAVASWKGKGECYYTNEQFAKMTNLQVRRVRMLINELAEMGYIKITMEYVAGNGHANKRRTIELLD